MLTNALPLNDLESDTPWHRLYWTLPVAIAIWIAILWSFAIFMGSANERLPEPAAIDAQMIELSQTPQTAKPSMSVPIPQTTIPQPSLEKTSPPSPEVKPVVEPNNSTAPVSSKEMSQTANSATANVGAKAIYQPIPKIPDELRQDALKTTAVALFHVATDGTSTVELLKPTPNPKLNRLLLATLKTWRFFPSIKDGKPVPSTEEIVIKVEIK